MRLRSSECSAIFRDWTNTLIKRERKWNKLTIITETLKNKFPNKRMSNLIKRLVAVSADENERNMN